MVWQRGGIYSCRWCRLVYGNERRRRSVDGAYLRRIILITGRLMRITGFTAACSWRRAR